MNKENIIEVLKTHYSLYNVSTGGSIIEKSIFKALYSKELEQELHRINNTVFDLKHKKGRGIVICGGGNKFIPGIWIAIHKLRQLGCDLPIEVWAFEEEANEEQFVNTVASLKGVNIRTCPHFDVVSQMHSYNMGRLDGFVLKTYSMLNSSFREVIFLDADNYPLINPCYLFDTPYYSQYGIILWKDAFEHYKKSVCWDILQYSSIPLSDKNNSWIESGQIIVDTVRHYKSLLVSHYFNSNGDFYYRICPGDANYFSIGCMLAGNDFFLMPYIPDKIKGMLFHQKNVENDVIFQHYTGLKPILSNNTIIFAGYDYTIDFDKEYANEISFLDYDNFKMLLDNLLRLESLHS